MIRTAYLRVYQPLDAFPEDERDLWVKHASMSDRTEASMARRWLMTSSLPNMGSLATPTEGAFVRTIDGHTLICPWRTRLRILAGMLAFRSSVPDEVADAFVPEMEAQRAARALAELGREKPEVRSHILHANWHVPLRWFALFEGSERILVEDSQGLRLRYETNLALARARLERCTAVLESSFIEDEVIEAVRELAGWLETFGAEGLVELDYGSVAGMFDDDDLLEDHSAEDICGCLDALERGDLIRAGGLFGELTERWSRARSREAAN